MSAQYDRDFYGWCYYQADLVRLKCWEKLDLENLVEEIESMGNEKRSELVNRLTVLLAHVLKWNYQPGYRTRGWVNTIEEQYERICDLIEENPSLKHVYPESFKKAYKYARREAANETRLPIETFPDKCDFKLEDFKAPEWNT